MPLIERCENCNCQRVSPGERKNIRVEPEVMIPHLRFIPCDWCGWDVLDHQTRPLDPAQAFDVAEMQRQYWQRSEKSAGVTKDYRNIFSTPGYRHCVDVLLNALRRNPLSILDIGSGPGTTLSFIAAQRPDLLPRISYTAIEPNPTFRDALSRLCRVLNIKADIRGEDLRGAVPILSGPFDLCVAMGSMIYIDPDDVDLFFVTHARSVSAFVMRDYFGLETHEEPHRLFMYNERFPMFAHNWRRYFKESGFSIRKEKPSITGLTDGHKWRTVYAERPDG